MSAVHNTQTPGKGMRTLLTPRKMQTPKPAASLTLAAKKKEILAGELAKLEKDLQYRTDLLERLQQRHEQLLTANGHLQEQNRLRREKLSTLQSALHETKLLTTEPNPSRSADSPANAQLAKVQTSEDMKELDVSVEKIGVVSSLLRGLHLRRVGLEKECMMLEENTTRQVSTMNAKNIALREVLETRDALYEDFAAAKLSSQMEQHEIERSEERIKFSLQLSRKESEHIQELTVSLAAKNRRIAELHNITDTFHAMAEDDVFQLQQSMDDQKRALKVQQRLLDRNGATCLKDEEVEQVSKSLSSKLGKLNEQVTLEKYYAREALLLVKQEKKILSILKGNIRSKESQLMWLQRQQLHHHKEYNQMVETATAKEHDYNEFASSYKLQSESLDDQLKVLSEAMAVVDNEVSVCMCDAANIRQQMKNKQESWQIYHDALSSKEKEILHFQTALKDMKKSGAKIAKAVSTQNERNEQLQKQLANFEMQNEDTMSAEFLIEQAIMSSERQSSTLENDLMKTTSSLDEAIEEFRAKFCSSFDRDRIPHIHNILNDEIARREMQENNSQDAFTKSLREKSRMFEEQYEKRTLDLTTKFREANQQKENEYHALLASLAIKQEEAHAKKLARDAISQALLQSQNQEMCLGPVIAETIGETTQDEEDHHLRIDYVRVCALQAQANEETHPGSMAPNDMRQDNATDFECDFAEPSTHANRASKDTHVGPNITKMIKDIFQSETSPFDAQTNTQRSQVITQTLLGSKTTMAVSSSDNSVDRLRSFAADASHPMGKPKASRHRETKKGKVSEDSSQFDEASCFVPETAKKRSTVSKARAMRLPRSKAIKASKKVSHNGIPRNGLKTNETSTRMSQMSKKKRPVSKATDTDIETSQVNYVQQHPESTTSKVNKDLTAGVLSTTKKTTIRRSIASRLTKSRQQTASQSVDWLADDTFSFD